MLLPSFSGIPLVLILLPLLSSVHAGDTVSTDSNTYGANSQSPYQTFISAPELKPPEILVTKNVGGLADGYLFIGLDGKPDSTQNVPCIYGQCCSCSVYLLSRKLTTNPFRHVTRSEVGHLGLDRN